jgi:peptidoglycan/LPS O-acetylase OafA/YrhL
MKTHRFLVLDGMRGVAAFAVLILHVVQQRDAEALPFAFLAVDFFYILSGFVVAFAYEQRLRSGEMSLPAFAWVRITRLYPLVLISVLAGILLAVMAAVVKGGITFGEIAVSGTLGLLLLPSYVFPLWRTAFPYNPGSWSLTFELFVNALYAVIAPFLTTPRLIMLIVASAVVLVWVAFMNQGIEVGPHQDNFHYGFGRVLFPFFAGVLLYRVRRPQRVAPKIAVGLLLALAALLFLPKGDAVLISLLYVFLFLPAIVMAGAAVDVGPRLGQACRLLGEISFPLYILQGPLLRVGDEVLKHLPSGMSVPGAVLFGCVEASIITAVAYAALRLYDIPVQRWLKQKAKRRATFARQEKPFQSQAS